ncbi:RBPJ-interacting and tubulin-associated protein 1 [Microcaecilia unicolor]|uniref:RBPJ-interacting and tubulin-associated protein 1 n=1 Tax=Microcaecilia unicolor TaxID=1415580 RepID=A0A6P7Z716_9AMPH|nr:RBPJ-interacting and tubulin-associated protein 1 [Microcaecilia unicolor]XP_030075149.1 RBPJ-interacting and tubulin-associated protein 1 [Microcaecilia unicolor]XP_030075150.1 RBPJ-interacting and tubulin-associated protein 1 [Microcaecilia unicolor]XP_030075151.1 RBPJ-interacting and tubulin-associated protein 1 [Microcaecilia unicolor]XP_030075152.1 RBPJ-interacting and tubulin-associated protein 1 [Microcaecilia unicolor]
MSTDLKITGIQAFRSPHKGRSGYRVKSSTCFVDETLFSSPFRSGRVSVPEFDPPWAEKDTQQRPLLWSPQTPNGIIRDHNASKHLSPVSTSRKYRLKNCFPSYCDEMLFGPKKEEPEWEAPWVKKADKPKPRPLLWIPLSTPKLQSNRSAKQLPLKTVHLRSAMSNLADFRPEYKTAAFSQQPESALGSPNLNLECRQSLSPLQRETLSVSRPSPNHRPPARARSSSFSKCVTRTVPVNTGKSRPPWK